MAHTEKVGASGRFGARYGKKVREKVTAVESKQRKKQMCPHCKRLGVKREAPGIWYCSRCKKKFTGGAYYLN